MRVWSDPVPTGLAKSPDQIRLIIRRDYPLFLKLVGEPLSLLINNKRVARGEVVVVNENFALKIIEILDPKDRINYLQS